MYQLCLAVTFPHSMVILSAMLEFECLACIEYEACCITQEQLRDPWWPVSSEADCTVLTKSQPGKSGKTPCGVETLPMEIQLPYGAACVNRLWKTNRATSNSLFSIGCFFRNERSMKVVWCSIGRSNRRTCRYCCWPALCHLPLAFSQPRYLQYILTSLDFPPLATMEFQVSANYEICLIQGQD